MSLRVVDSKCTRRDVSNPTMIWSDHMFLSRFVNMYGDDLRWSNAYSHNFNASASNYNNTQKIFIRNNKRPSFKSQYLAYVFIRYCRTIYRQLNTYSFFLLKIKKILKENVYFFNNEKLYLTPFYEINRKVKSRVLNTYRLKERPSFNFYKKNRIFFYINLFKKKFYKNRNLLWRMLYRVPYTFWGFLLKNRIQYFIYRVLYRPYKFVSLHYLTENYLTHVIFDILYKYKRRTTMRRRNKRKMLFPNSAYTQYNYYYKKKTANKIINNRKNLKKVNLLSNDVIFNKVSILSNNIDDNHFISFLKNYSFFQIVKQKKYKKIYYEKNMKKYYGILRASLPNDNTIKTKLIRTGVVSRLRKFTNINHVFPYLIIIKWYQKYLTKHINRGKFNVYKYINKYKMKKKQLSLITHYTLVNCSNLVLYQNRKLNKNLNYLYNSIISNNLRTITNNYKSNKHKYDYEKWYNLFKRYYFPYRFILSKNGDKLYKKKNKLLLQKEKRIISGLFKRKKNHKHLFDFTFSNDYKYNKFIKYKKRKLRKKYLFRYYRKRMRKLIKKKWNFFPFGKRNYFYKLVNNKQFFYHKKIKIKIKKYKKLIQLIKNTKKKKKKLYYRKYKKYVIKKNKINFRLYKKYKYKKNNFKNNFILFNRYNKNKYNNINNLNKYNNKNKYYDNNNLYKNRYNNKKNMSRYDDKKKYHYDSNLYRNKYKKINNLLYNDNKQYYKKKNKFNNKYNNKFVFLKNNNQFNNRRLNKNLFFKKKNIKKKNKYFKLKNKKRKKSIVLLYNWIKIHTNYYKKKNNRINNKNNNIINYSINNENVYNNKNNNWKYNKNKQFNNKWINFNKNNYKTYNSNRNKHYNRYNNKTDKMHIKYNYYNKNYNYREKNGNWYSRDRNNRYNSHKHYWKSKGRNTKYKKRNWINKKKQMKKRVYLFSLIYKGLKKINKLGILNLKNEKKIKKLIKKNVIFNKYNNKITIKEKIYNYVLSLKKKNKKKNVLLFYNIKNNRNDKKKIYKKLKTIKLRRMYRRNKKYYRHNKKNKIYVYKKKILKRKKKITKLQSIIYELDLENRRLYKRSRILKTNKFPIIYNELYNERFLCFKIRKKFRERNRVLGRNRRYRRMTGEIINKFEKFYFKQKFNNMENGIFLYKNINIYCPFYKNIYPGNYMNIYKWMTTKITNNLVIGNYKEYNNMPQIEEYFYKRYKIMMRKK